jgi:ATP-dependent RNA helicase DDX1
VAAAASSRGEKKPLAIILEPARDLAEQTHNCVLSFKKHLTSPALEGELLVGGLDAKQQAKSLARGLDIVTGTPGR